MVINTENIPWADVRLQETGVPNPKWDVYISYPSLQTPGSSRRQGRKVREPGILDKSKKMVFSKYIRAAHMIHSNRDSNHKTPYKLTATATATTRPRATSQTNLQQGKWEGSPSTS